MGHEERFPATRLGAGYGFRKETLAGTRRNGRDAPMNAGPITGSTARARPASETLPGSGHSSGWAAAEELDT
jgi:hypothetical protein